jgi:hypothetical protein
MAYTKSADGIIKKGKTDVQVFPTSGPSQKEIMGGKKTAGVTGKSMRAVGRNMARAMNQKRG